MPARASLTFLIMQGIGEYDYVPLVSSSADRRLVGADELRAQLALQHLAGGVARQDVDEGRPTAAP